MPALNIIATHDTVRNSGPSSSRPSGMLPNLLTASQITKTTNALAVSTNSQPVLVMTHVSDLSDAVAEARLADETPDDEGDRDRCGDPEDEPSVRVRTARRGSASTGKSSAGCGTTSSTGEESASATRLRFWVGVVCS